ncbi:MAG: 6-phosphogluconolactonase, partial [Alphaproteobacteria bacterium]|nr:6-phosphogluconolactonase [Alphaproteobacteria bacterium]
PTQALTIGLQTIFNAKQIIIMATGNKKYNAVKTVSSGQVSVNCPTTLLNNHNDAVIICDEAAYPQN